MKPTDANTMPHEDYHFVSPETPQHKEVPVDKDHVMMTEAPAVPREDSKDQHVRSHETGVVEMGAVPNRTIMKTPVAERHITSAPGMDDAMARKEHIKSTRIQREKENFGE
jgi:hypothetical protein